MADPGQASSEKAVDGSPKRATKWRQRYEGSAVQDLVRTLGAIEFGDRIILFGAALLLSVLPLIILLSALANQRVDDDLARHLGLGRQGTRILEGLFRTTSVSFNFGVFVSLVLSFVGTIAVARSIQVIMKEPSNSRMLGEWGICFVASCG